MSNRAIRVGIIGAGRNSTTMHIPKLQALDGVEIVSICNRSHESSERVARKFGIPTIYDRWWELAAAPDTNAVVIGTWPYLHCPATLAALAADKHVMCEARMAMNATEAAAMLEAAQANPHLVTKIVPSPMTLGVDKTIERLIAEGFLGDASAASSAGVLAIEVRAAGAFLDLDAPLRWRQDADLSGCNVMSLGIWYEALMRWVGEATRVTAMGKTFVKMCRDLHTGTMKVVRIPEHLNVIADMACGAQANFFISNVAGLAGPNGVTLYGSAGTLRFSESKLYGAQRGDAALQEIAIPPEEAGGWRVEEEFLNAIREQEEVTYTTFEDGVKYMQFTEAVARSMAEGVAVSLPLSPANFQTGRTYAHSSH